MYFEGIRSIKGVRTRCSPVRFTRRDPDAVFSSVQAERRGGSPAAAPCVGCQVPQGRMLRAAGPSAMSTEGRTRRSPRAARAPSRGPREDPSTGVSLQWLSPCHGGHTEEWAALGREIHAGDGSNNPGNHDQNLLSDKGARTRHHN